MAGKLFSDAVINFTVNTQNALQQVTGFQRNFNNTVGQLKTVVGGFIGYQGLKGAYNSLMDIVHASERWHVPVEKVSAFANLFTEFGGSADEAVASLDKLESAINDLQMHSSGPLRELSTRLMTNLNNKDFMGVIESIRAEWPRLTNQGKNDLIKTLGLDPIAFQRMIEASPEEFKNALLNAQKNVLTEEKAKDLVELEKNIAEIKKNLTEIAVPILQWGNNILGPLKKALEAFNRQDESTKDAFLKGAISLWLAKKLGAFAAVGTATGVAGTAGATGAATTAGATSAGVAGLAKGTGTAAWIYAIIDVIPSLVESVADLVEGTKNLEEAVDEFQKKSSLARFGSWWVRQTVGAEWMKLFGDDFYEKYNPWLNNPLPFTSKEDEYKFRTERAEVLFNKGLITEEEYKKIIQGLKDWAKKSDYQDVLNGSRGFIPFANADVAQRTLDGARAWGKNSPTQNVNQVINIYGVTGAEDAIDKLGGAALNTLTPTMGPQG